MRKKKKKKPHNTIPIAHGIFQEITSLILKIQKGCKCETTFSGKVDFLKVANDISALTENVLINPKVYF